VNFHASAWSVQHVQSAKDAARQLIAQDCFQPPNSASSFSDFVYLKFEQSGNMVRESYKLFYSYHWVESYINGAPDEYIISKDRLVGRKRKIWESI
jgi:hypothetical protein